MITYFFLLVCQIIPCETVDAIDPISAKEVMVRSFMDGYKEVPLHEMNPDFTTREDMKHFYEDYFDSELSLFHELVWVQAFDGDKLVGWATFLFEEENKAYMNLLVVDPEEQGKGIGKQLVFSIYSLYPHVDEIRLLLRKVNVKGRQFYEHIGFTDFDYQRKDNFVDVSLLTGLHLMGKPPGE